MQCWLPDDVGYNASPNKGSKHARTAGNYRCDYLQIDHQAFAKGQVYTMLTWILLAHLAATLFMVGLIWCIQVVQYPLFGAVGVDGFAAYHAGHTARITWVVGPPMLLEGATAALLVWLHPANVNVTLLWIGVALLLVTWLSTLLLQVPRHNLLSHGFDQRVYQALVATNWVRTIAWSARGGLVLWLAAQAMR